MLQTFDRSQRSAKSVEMEMSWPCGVGRYKTATLSVSREPVDDYFESPWVEGKPAVAGLNLNCLDICPCFDAVLPLNYTVGFRVDESLRNARRKPTHLNFRDKPGCKPAGASPMRPFKQRPQKCIRALKRRFHRRTQQYRPLNQGWKPAGKFAAYDAPFPDERFKAGARQFPILVPIAPDDPAVPANRKAWEVLRRWEKPFLTAFSDGDPVTKGGELLLQSAIPGARNQPHATIKGAGHFLQEDKGEELARVIVNFTLNNS